MNLVAKPDWLWTKNPIGQVPVLERDDVTVYESIICNEYLEANYPENPTLPSDPLEKAKQLKLAERLNQVEYKLRIPQILQ